VHGVVIESSLAGIASVGASGRKGLFATKVAALGLVGTKLRTTVSPI
jgi:hypothetical protein